MIQLELFFSAVSFNQPTNMFFLEEFIAIGKLETMGILEFQTEGGGQFGFTPKGLDQIRKHGNMSKQGKPMT